MMKHRRSAAMIAASLTLMLVAAACSSDEGSGDASATDGVELTGSITISGSSTVEPISSTVAEVFNETNTQVAIDVSGPGTGDGFELFCNGETDISDASRPIDEDEVKACQKNGIEYVELEIGLDGVTVMTNPENSAVTCLNNGDLYALFGPQSNEIDTWNGADSLASEVGGTGGFPDAPLEITAPGKESGTYDAFIDLAGIEDIALEQGVPEDDAASLRSVGYQASPSDNVIITAIEGSPSSLGFVGFAFAEAAGESVKEIQVDGGSGCVAPTPETISDGSYPLSRSLYIYVNKAKAAENAALAAYVDYYVGEEALNTLVTQAGYIALPADRVSATQAAWESGQAA